MKLFRTENTGASQTTEETQNEKIKVVDDISDLSGLNDGEIIATKITELPTTDNVASGNMSALTSGGMYDAKPNIPVLTDTVSTSSNEVISQKTMYDTINTDTVTKGNVQHTLIDQRVRGDMTGNVSPYYFTIPNYNSSHVYIGIISGYYGYNSIVVSWGFYVNQGSFGHEANDMNVWSISFSNGALSCSSSPYSPMDYTCIVWDITE